MKDGEANVALIKHVTKRLEEFFYENDPASFDSLEDMQHVFSLWLHRRDRLEHLIEDKGRPT